jgi:hypothetical protein
MANACDLQRGAAKLVVVVVVAVALCALVSGTPLAKDVLHGGLRFDSPGVLDLAERTQEIAGGSAVPVVPLPEADANAIIAAPSLGEEHPSLRFSDEEYACSPPSRKCSRAHERALIEASGGAARRDGSHLVILSSAGAAADFVDWSMATTKSADGDEATHAYLGRLGGSGYHRVEVQFGHDAPGNFLVNPENGKIAFVHNGSDVVVPAPDGLRLVAFNAMNPPLSLRVAVLDATGPRLALTCTVNRDSAATAQFKGWHDAHGFDLALLAAGAGGEESVPLRISHDARGWSVAASDFRRVSASGFSCSQTPP